MGRKSISQRLKNTKSMQIKEEIALDWSANWHQEQADLVAQLGKAISADDYDQLCIIAGQLKTVTSKRFEALPNVIRLLLEASVNNSLVT
jgi:hypothetical protein